MIRLETCEMWSVKVENEYLEVLWINWALYGYRKGWIEISQGTLKRKGKDRRKKERKGKKRMSIRMDKRGKEEGRKGGGKGGKKRRRERGKEGIEIRKMKERARYSNEEKKAKWIKDEKYQN